MKINSTKAMTAGFLVVLIITLVAFFLIATTIYKFTSKSGDASAETLCKDSVALRAAATLSLGKDKSTELKTVPVLCKTIDKKISGKKEDVEKIIADKMVKCWQMFGEGRYQKNIFNNINLYGGNAKCFMCYTIIIDDSSSFNKKSGEYISDLEFHDYLGKTTYGFQKAAPAEENKVETRSELNYLNYFQFGGGNGYVTRFLTPEGIKPGRAYAIMFKAKHEDCGSACGLSVVAGGATLAASFVTKSVGTGVAGAAAVYGGAEGLIRDALKTETNVDGIIISDMSEENLRHDVLSACYFESDVAGGGGY